MKTIPDWLRWLFALAWTVVTVVLLLLPTVRLPTTFLGDLTDKAAHFVTFGLLAALWYWALIVYYPHKQALRVAISITLLLGIVTELAQGYVPGRSTDIFDFTADGLGASTAAVILHWLQGWRLNRRWN